MACRRRRPYWEYSLRERLYFLFFFLRQLCRLEEKKKRMRRPSLLASEALRATPRNAELRERSERIRKRREARASLATLVLPAALSRLRSFAPMLFRRREGPSPLRL